MIVNNMCIIVRHIIAYNNIILHNMNRCNLSLSLYMYIYTYT